MISALRVSERNTLKDILRWGLAGGGSLAVGMGIGMILAGRDNPGEGLRWFWPGFALFVAGGVGMVIGLLLLWRPRFCELYVRRTSFGFRDHELGCGPEYDLADVVGVDPSARCIHLTNGRTVQIPGTLCAHSCEIEGVLRYYGGLRREIPTAHDWNFSFSNEAPVPSPPAVSGLAEIDSEGSLRGLIADYCHAIVFRDALPAAWAMAKMFSRFRQSNGGLVLFGVRPDASMVGLPEAEIEKAAERLRALAADLTNARVEVGRIELDGKTALFAVFNPIHSHTKPLERFEGAVSEVKVV